jgi:mono/diheme cytochrome c family protein
MRRYRIGAVVALGAGTITLVLLAAQMAGAQAASAARGTLVKKLLVQRTSASDLEIGGDVEGVPRGETRYLKREDLLAISQVTFTVTDDPNFKRPTQIKGVTLEELARDLGVPPSAGVVIAICNDKYRATYPREYVAQHHPVLVLEIDGKSPAGWPMDSGGHGFDMGPYMISHEKFTPSFKILSHSDEAQIPWGVVRLEFRDKESVFGALAPRGPRANDPAVKDGYSIAKQNCFRCHNAGDQSGQKSGVTWTVLSALASGSPEFFMDYVRNPKSKSPQAQMPGNPNYDDTTLLALTRYFQTLAPAAKL